jgi:serine/threonine protein phosphatase 1
MENNSTKGFQSGIVACSMAARLIAVGDIHGCLPALQAIINAVATTADDTIVALGDYIDRGPQSMGTLECMLQLRTMCNLVPLLGNHDEMLLDIIDGQTDLLSDWCSFGGRETLMSYGSMRVGAIPKEHVEFLRNCRLFYETAQYIFLHATYDPALPMERQKRSALLWGKIRPMPPGPHCSGKTVIVGHTAQRDGKILDLGYLKCIDTCCYGDGWLTAMELPSGKTWQADKAGRMRDEGMMDQR